MSRTTDLARINLVDATTIAALIDAALRSLHDNLGGYPTSTPGAAPLAAGLVTTYAGLCQEPGCEYPARPCPDHDTPVNLTQPERLALAGNPAAADMKQLAHDLAAAQVLLARAARLAVRWGMAAVSSETVTQRLTTIDQGIWCTNCARHGQRNPRGHERTECDFCASFRLDYGLPASKAIWQARDARGGKIYVQDIERILDRDSKGWRKRRPKPKPAPTVDTTKADVA